MSNETRSSGIAGFNSDRNCREIPAHALYKNSQRHWQRNDWQGNVERNFSLTDYDRSIWGV